MKLELLRTYFPKGTNGVISLNGKPVCNSIELPWLQNQHQISCVPEGEYELEKRYSPKFQWHLQLLNVPNRDLILIHPANDAQKELKGCIAPVLFLTGEGKGIHSKSGLKMLLDMVIPELQKGNKIYLQIHSVNNLK